MIYEISGKSFYEVRNRQGEFVLVSIGEPKEDHQTSIEKIASEQGLIAKTEHAKVDKKRVLFSLKE